MTNDGAALNVDELLAQSGWLRALACQLVGESEAEDLAQDTMLAALRRPPRPGVPLRAWLSGISRKIALSRRRGAAHRAQREARVAAENARRSGPTPAELLGQVEAQRALAQALLVLKEPYRHTLIQRYHEGLSSAEIARRSGVPDGTVRWRLSRGLALMRAELDQRHEGQRALWLAPLSAWSAGGQAGRRVALSGGSTALLAGLTLLAALATLWIARRATVARGARDAASAVEPSASAGAGAATSSATGARQAALGPLEGATRLVRFRVRAVDEVGADVPGASLRARDGTESAVTGGSESELALDARALDREHLIELELSAPGRVPRRIGARWRGEERVLLGDQQLARAVTLAGRVLEPDGTPAAGATVLIESLPGRYELGRPASERLYEWAYLGSMLPASAPRVRSDPDGRYRFDALPEGYHRVWARTADTIAACSEPLALTDVARFDAPTLRLAAPTPHERLEGRVVDPRGAPVPGARLRAWRATRSTLEREHDERAYHAVADDQGRFVLVVNPNPLIELRASDPARRFAESELVQVRGGARGVVVELREQDETGPTLPRPNQTLSGSVTHDGRPLPAARVELVRLLDAKAFRAVAWDPVGFPAIECRVDRDGILSETLTDERGAFALPRPAGVALGLRVFAAGCAPCFLELQAEATSVSIELTQGARLEGRVVDAEGHGAPGVIVGASAGDGVLHTARSGADGAYAIDGLPVGGVQVRCLQRDLALAEEHTVLIANQPHPERSQSAQPRWDLLLSADGANRFELELARAGGPRLRGRFLLDGAAPGPWHVELQCQTQRTSAACASSDLDPRGRFDLRVPEPGVYPLELWYPSTYGPWVRWKDRVRIDASGARWEQSFETGELAPLPGEWLDEPREQLVVIWRGPGELTVEARMTRAQLAREPVLRLPAGTLELRRPDDEPGTAPLRLVVLPPGARLALALGPE